MADLLAGSAGYALDPRERQAVSGVLGITASTDSFFFKAP
jgi:cellobiose phosphorylase